VRTFRCRACGWTTTHEGEACSCPRCGSTTVVALSATVEDYIDWECQQCWERWSAAPDDTDMWCPSCSSEEVAIVEAG
jgi:Zn finger protein HypA/HybF involved in hydrogenase expression